MADHEECCRQAALCIRAALATKNARHKLAWLELAQDWVDQADRIRSDGTEWVFNSR